MSMHVAMSGWLLGPHSGANRRLLSVLAALSQKLHGDERITVLHHPTYEPPSLSGPIEWHSVPIVRHPTWRRALGERLHLDRILRRINATLLDHAMLPAPRVSCPLALTIHDLRATDGFGSHAAWLERAALRRACKRAAVVVAPSNFTQSRITDTASPRRIEVIANGVDLPQVRTTQPTGHLLHVGHLEPRKNLDLLLRALAQLPHAQRPTLLLAGADAGSGPSLRQLAGQLELGESVRFLGTVDEEMLHDLYQTARAVLVPSRYEGFGLCALEGLAHGRPVLAAQAAALPEITAGYAVQLPVDDPAAWATAISNTQTTQAQPCNASIAHAAQFTWNRTADQLLTLWREVSA